MPSDTTAPPAPITLTAALKIIQELHDRATADESDAKPAEARAIVRNKPLIAALAAIEGPEVADLLEALRDVRGFAQPTDQIRRAIALRRNRGASKEIDMDVWGELKMKIKADGTIGGPESTLRNAECVLRLDPTWQGRLRFNQLSHVVHIDGAKVEDIDEINATIWLDDTYGLQMSTALTHDAMQAVARQDAYHPVRDYLDSLEWDTDSRIEYWLTEFCGSPDKTIVRAYARRWMISAVARAFEPGCKVDTTLILQGEQGAKKSWALQTLCGEWFSDTVLDLRNKDAMQALQGVWIYEFAELDSVARQDTTMVKAFLSSKEDRFRLPYARNVIPWKRQCVIVGTSNETGFLKDPTGSRRFWPVQTGDIDLDGLARARDQLWAEAVHLYRKGEQWWLTKDEDGRRKKSAHLFTEEDAWRDAVLAWLVKSQRVEVTVVEVWRDALGKRQGDMKQTSQKRLARILRDDGWTMTHLRSGNVWRQGI